MLPRIWIDKQIKQYTRYGWYLEGCKYLRIIRTSVDELLSVSVDEEDISFYSEASRYLKREYNV